MFSMLFTIYGLSHCCIIDISFIISCKSLSTGTCLIATVKPVSLCRALNTLPYEPLLFIKKYILTLN